MRSKFEQVLVSLAFLVVFMFAWLTFIGLHLYKPEVDTYRGCFYYDFHRYEVCPNERDS